MNQVHPLYKEPAAGGKLWRYMDLWKFVDLLANGSLYFPRADRLGDPWEGAVSSANLRERDDFVEVMKIDPRQGKVMGGLISAENRRALRRTYVSCWHMNRHESAAMWKLYGEAVAVETTFKHLKAGLIPRSDWRLEFAKVLYKEYVPEDALLIRKRISFRHEREVRALIREPFGIEGEGVPVPVSLSALIRTVWVAPTAGDWMKNAVQSLLDKFGLTCTARKSSIGDEAVH